MNPHNLPPLPQIGQPPAPGATHTNPGLVDVASQCYPAVRTEEENPSSPGTGLAVDVRPDLISHVKLSPPTVAETTSPAVTVNADTPRTGGLPVNVNIR
jgi:hypothetical protein